MGATLDTPAKCPVCNELTRDPVILKCNHRYCKRCIGDLWSINPNGPYSCPEFRCKTAYQTLPFDRSLLRPSGSSRGTLPHSSSGDACSGEENTFDSLLRGHSVSKFLGKRKANSSVSGQPDAKRSPVRSQGLLSNDNDTASSSDIHWKGKKGENILGSTQSEFGEGPSSTGKCVAKQKPACDSDHPSNVSVQQNENDVEMLLGDSDSSNEVDLCDSSLFSIPKRNIQEGVSPKKSSSSTNSNKSVESSHFRGDKSPAATSGSPSQVDTSPVPCHYCPKSGRQIAVKTCLVCGASMCKEHLRPHLDSPVFQTHTLVSPLEDISLWRCQEHQEINRIYCRQCSMCVCTVCTVIGFHRDHACISIKEAERELRENLKEAIKKLQEAEQQISIKVSELTQRKETYRVVLNEACVVVKAQYGAIREALEQEEQLALQCVEKEEKRVLSGLEKKLSHLQNSLHSTQKGLHRLEVLADTKGNERIQDQVFVMEYTKVAQMYVLLSEILHSCFSWPVLPGAEPQTSDMGHDVDQSKPLEEINHSRLKCLQRWTEKRLDSVVFTLPGTDGNLYRLLYGFTPCLDADTAHPKLLLSDNGRKVNYTEVQQAYTDHEARFTSFPQVLGSSSLNGGRWYWEVSVSVDDGRWKVGLSEARIERKGQKDNSRLGFNSYSWCLTCDRKKVEALHNKVSAPVEADMLQTVGVFLDFDEGILSFFNVSAEGNVALMYSFKHSFTEPLFPALSVSKTQLTICEFM